MWWKRPWGPRMCGGGTLPPNGLPGSRGGRFNSPAGVCGGNSMESNLDRWPLPPWWWGGDFNAANPDRSCKNAGTVYLWRYSLKIKTIENTSQYKMGWITSNLYPEKDHIGLKNQLILYWLKKITLSLWQHTQQSSYKAKIVEHRIFLLTCFSKVYESFRSLESE